MALLVILTRVTLLFIFLFITESRWSPFLPLHEPPLPPVVQCPIYLPLILLTWLQHPSRLFMSFPVSPQPNLSYPTCLDFGLSLQGLSKSPHTWQLADAESVMGVRHSEGAVGRFWRPEVLGSTVTPGAGGSKKRSRKVRNDVVTLGMGTLPKQDVAKMLSKTLKVSNRALSFFFQCRPLIFCSSLFHVRLKLSRRPYNPRQQFTRSLSTFLTPRRLLFLADPFALLYSAPQLIMALSRTSVFALTTTPLFLGPRQPSLVLLRLFRMHFKSKLLPLRVPRPITRPTLAFVSPSGVMPMRTDQPPSVVPSKMPRAPARSLTMRLQYILLGSTASAPS